MPATPYSAASMNSNNRIAARARAQLLLARHPSAPQAPPYAKGSPLWALTQAHLGQHIQFGKETGYFHIEAKTGALLHNGDPTDIDMLHPQYVTLHSWHLKEAK